eukprot:568934-Pleurochrysis_carterae.AAC.1
MDQVGWFSARAAASRHCVTGLSRVRYRANWWRRANFCRVGTWILEAGTQLLSVSAGARLRLL